MFSPTPSTITLTGKLDSSSAPAQYSDVRGPGTLEITRFSGGRGRLRISTVLRAASEATAGGMNAVASVSSEAGSAEWRSLALRRYSWVRRRRAAGSATLVGIGTIIIEIRLPHAPFSSRLRTDIGIRATSGSSGSASRSTSKPRPAPAQNVPTTSLTVVPTSRRPGGPESGEGGRNANRRCAETGPLNGVLGGRALVTSSTPALSSAPNVRRTRE